MAESVTARRPARDYREHSGEYWDARHRTRDDLASGGRIDIDRAGNEIFLALRTGQLLTLIGDLASATEPLYVLDAGCGKGAFARTLARCGHRVDAFDRSGVAIEYCRSQGAGPRYAVAELAAWRSPWLYDVVICVDVFFHVLDDGEWRAGLRNLASLVRLTGSLIIADGSFAERHSMGDYILHRPLADYQAVLDPIGLRHRSFTPYAFRDSKVGFHAFTRIG
jgi:2-polyprenyl-3-methyl-5-hydroxy-6-metoxy-1,4-benzoquinol methylase